MFSKDVFRKDCPVKNNKNQRPIVIKEEVCDVVLCVEPQSLDEGETGADGHWGGWKPDFNPVGRCLFPDSHGCWLRPGPRSLCSLIRVFVIGTVMTEVP